MKFPGIEYRTQVQGLGRQDISAPLALASAKASVLEGVSHLVGRMEVNEVAATAAQFQKEMAEMNANMANRKSFTIDELDHLEVKYGEKYGIDGLQEVPSYLVSKQVYQKLSRDIYDRHVLGAGKKEKSVISKMYGGMYKSGVSIVIRNSIVEAYNVRSAATEIDFDNAVDSGNREAATIIAETAKATGLWDANKYLAKTKNMPDKIAQSGYLNELNRSDDPVILENYLDGLLNDPDLNPASKNSLFRQYEAKIKQVENKISAANTEVRKKRSYDDFVVNSTNMLDDGEPMPWNEVMDITLDMEPSDGKGLITLNKMIGEKGTVTDPKTHMLMTLKIKTLSLPREGTDIYQRRESAINDLILASGYDPVTKERIGSSKISPEDFVSMFNDINRSQAFVYDNPEVKRVVDQVYLSLTGASKDMISSVLGEGPNVVNAVLAEKDLLEASREGGPGFNPDAWWEQNGEKYYTSALEDNLQTLKENRLDKYMVTDLTMPGFINIDKTIENVAGKVKAKTLTQEEADKIMKSINELHRLRVEKTNFMEKR